LGGGKEWHFANENQIGVYEPLIEILIASNCAEKGVCSYINQEVQFEQEQ